MDSNRSSKVIVVALIVTAFKSMVGFKAQKHEAADVLHRSLMLAFSAWLLDQTKNH